MLIKSDIWFVWFICNDIFKEELFSYLINYTCVRNILTIYPVSKLDKGKQISCRATDDLGMISDSSEVINLDPYCE
jgi:hypothetical protein